MQETKTSKKYSYTYSASESERVRKEVEKIRSQYITSSDQKDALKDLKALDKKVKNYAATIGISFGIIAVLVMGTGMSLAMAYHQMIPGIIVGLLGIGMIAATYPLYQYILKKRKARYADAIIKLSDQLLN